MFIQPKFVSIAACPVFRDLDGENEYYVGLTEEGDVYRYHLDDSMKIELLFTFDQRTEKQKADDTEVYIGTKFPV